MEKRIFNFLAIVFIAVSCTSKVEVKPPVAKKIPKELTIHGDTRIDNYYWMNERENPEVIAHLEAENAYKEAVMAHTKPLQDRLFEEIKSKIKQDNKSVPYKKNGYFLLHPYSARKRVLPCMPKKRKSRCFRRSYA